MIETWHRLQELNEKFSRLSVDEARALFEEEVCVTAARPEWEGLSTEWKGLSTAVFCVRVQRREGWRKSSWQLLRQKVCVVTSLIC